MEPAVEELSEIERIGLLCSDGRDWQEGWAQFERTREPHRLLETHLTTMDSSLPKLPSFRMIAGWFVVVGGVILAFALTH